MFIGGTTFSHISHRNFLYGIPILARHATLSTLTRESLMASAEPNVDYYAVLEVSNIATIEVVTKSYRRLAKIRHPDKNLKADSTAVFQLVCPIH